MRRVDGLLLEPDEVVYLGRVLAIATRSLDRPLAPPARMLVAKIVAAAAETADKAAASGRYVAPQTDSSDAGDHEHIDVSAAARILGCSERNARDLCARGAIRAHRVGGRWCIDAADAVARAERRAAA